MSIIKILDTWTYLKRYAVTYYQVTVNETITGVDPEDGFSSYGYAITYSNGNSWSGEAVPAGTVLTITAWADGEGFVNVNGENISNAQINITISQNTTINIECGYYTTQTNYILTFEYTGESMCSVHIYANNEILENIYNTGTYTYELSEGTYVEIFAGTTDPNYEYSISAYSVTMNESQTITLNCWYNPQEPELATLIIEPDMGAYVYYFDWGLENARFNVESHGPYLVDNVTLGFSGNVNGDKDSVIWYAGDTVSINLQPDCNTRYWMIDTETLQSIQLAPGENRIFIPCTFIQ